MHWYAVMTIITAFLTAFIEPAVQCIELFVGELLELVGPRDFQFIHIKRVQTSLSSGEL